MPRRGRASTLTRTTASRTGAASRPMRVSREDYEANPGRYRDAIPVIGSQTRQIVFYIARRGG